MMNEDDWALIVRTVFTSIFGEKEKRTNKHLFELAKENEALTNEKTFSWQGLPITRLDNILFPKQALTARPKIRRKPIHPDLYERLEALMNTITILDDHQARVTNFFAVAKTRLNTDQDVRDAFPNVVLEATDLDHIKGLPRTREPGYAFMRPSGTGKLKIYEEMERIALHYAADELLY